MTPLLDTLTDPASLRALPSSQLPVLAEEVRRELIRVVSQTGGHLGAGLGVVELTVALHYIFNTPDDILIWDTGHQAYPHKMLTGRRSLLPTLRQGGGLSGFTKRDESPYDAFGAGHASTSISAALGFAVARDVRQQQHNVVAVIGDSAMSGGMAFEALNCAGDLRSRLVVILNDNDMSIAPPTGALRPHFSRLISSGSYTRLRDIAKKMAQRLPSSMERAIERLEEYARGMVVGGTLFEELGLYYVGPIDGHNFSHLLPVLKNIRDKPGNAPVLVHVVTEKGKGYLPAEQAADKYHSVSGFDITTGQQHKPVAKAPTYTKVFADTVLQAARLDDKIVAITAAMPDGTGLAAFAKELPKRFYDVGIAEQHAVTFAAGLAAGGLKPVVALYSTFLQRGYDQLIHDVALQNLPVRFAIDRAGLVGADGATHAGSFDLAYLSCIPNMVVMAPSDEAELVLMLNTSLAYNAGPSAVRYPRGEGVGVALPPAGQTIPIGQGRIIRRGENVALLSLGTRLQDCLRSAETLAAQGYNITVADARFAKPIDEKLLVDLAAQHHTLITVEEGARGGFGAQVLHYLANQGWLDNGLTIRTLCLPDYFQNHDTQAKQLAEAGLDEPAITKTVLSLLSNKQKLKKAS